MTKAPGAVLYDQEKMALPEAKIIEEFSDGIRKRIYPDGTKEEGEFLGEGKAHIP